MRRATAVALASVLVGVFASTAAATTPIGVVREVMAAARADLKCRAASAFPLAVTRT